MTIGRPTMTAEMLTALDDLASGAARKTALLAAQGHLHEAQTVFNYLCAHEPQNTQARKDAWSNLRACAARVRRLSRPA